MTHIHFTFTAVRVSVHFLLLSNSPNNGYPLLISFRCFVGESMTVVAALIFHILTVGQIGNCTRRGKFGFRDRCLVSFRHMKWVIIWAKLRLLRRRMVCNNWRVVIAFFVMLQRGCLLESQLTLHCWHTKLDPASTAASPLRCCTSWNCFPETGSGGFVSHAVTDRVGCAETNRVDHTETSCVDYNYTETSHEDHTETDL